MNDDDVTPIGQVDFRQDHRVFGIKRKDRRYHLLTIGRTGTGKSTLLAGLIRSDLERGEGVAVLDPHGDLAETAARFVGRERRDVFVFRPGDPNNRLTFNPLHVARPDQRHLVVSELMTVFQHIWERAWGPRLEYILRITLLTLTERPGHSLIDALRMLSDAEFRATVIEKIEDPILLAFWNQEFAKYSKGYRTEAIAPIQNKLGEFLINPVLRAVFEHPEGDIQPRTIMDQGQVFIADLSVGRIGRDVATLLGATLIGKFALAALSRSDQPPDERRDFYFYVDEFPMFATESISTILSEARKYRLALVMAMQYLEQLPNDLLAGVLGNVGNIVSFRVGAKDAGILEREFLPVFSREDLISLPYYHAYVRMMIDNKPARPFSAKVMMPDFKR
jgi:hypothetical protein